MQMSGSSAAISYQLTQNESIHMLVSLAEARSQLRSYQQLE